MLTMSCSNILGWRIGWVCAGASIASSSPASIINIHVKLTDSAPAPFQEAALIALTSTPDYYESLKTVRFAVNRL
jgi:aspartate/methionine/tyrosine aminotransferase